MDGNGFTGPTLFPHTLDTEVLDEVEITVPAGTFQTRLVRFRFGDNLEKVQDNWIAAGTHFVKVRCEPLRTNYILVELKAEG